MNPTNASDCLSVERHKRTFFQIVLGETALLDYKFLHELMQRSAKCLKILHIRAPNVRSFCRYITKETMEPNNRVLLKGFIVLIVLFLLLYVMCASVPKKQNPEPDPGHSSKMTPSCKWPLCVVFVSPRKRDL